MFVQPAPGLTIRDPDLFDFLPNAGREVPQTDYWHRRLRDGDVVEAPAPAEPALEVTVQALDTTETTGE